MALGVMEVQRKTPERVTRIRARDGGRRGNKVRDGGDRRREGGGSDATLLAGLEALQARLPATGFAVGEWSIADVAGAPVLIRIMTHLEHDVGKQAAGEGTKTLAELRKPKYARVMKYIEDVINRPSVQATWSTVSLFRSSSRVCSLLS